MPARMSIELTKEEIAEVRTLIEKHRDHTGSLRAKTILEEWGTHGPKFVKVMPKDYKRVLRLRADAEEKGMDPMVAVMGGLNG